MVGISLHGGGLYKKVDIYIYISYIDKACTPTMAGFGWSDVAWHSLYMKARLIHMKITKLAG